MGPASFVLIRTKFIAKGNYESHGCQNETTITMYHSMSLGRSLSYFGVRNTVAGKHCGNKMAGC